MFSLVFCGLVSFGVGMMVLCSMEMNGPYGLLAVLLSFSTTFQMFIAVVQTAVRRRDERAKEKVARLRADESLKNQEIVIGGLAENTKVSVSAAKNSATAANNSAEAANASILTHNVITQTVTARIEELESQLSQSTSETDMLAQVLIDKGMLTHAQYEKMVKRRKMTGKPLETPSAQDRNH